MKKLTMFLIGIVISVLTFSQNTLKTITNSPRMIKDSTGLTFIIFNEEQVTILIKELKQNELNKNIIIELENQLLLLKTNNKLLKENNDSLNSLISSYIEIKINLESQVDVQEKKIELLNNNITKLSSINDNLKKEIEVYKGKIKRKNNWILKLAITNTITASLLILILL